MNKQTNTKFHVHRRPMSALNEDVEQVPTDNEEKPKENLGYTVDAFVRDKEMQGYGWYVIPAITKSLTELKTLCDKHKIAFEWEVTRVDDDEKKKHGWKIVANAAMPDLKVEGYTYIGSVVPLTDDYALVAPSEEFRENFEVLDKIKTTVSKEKCAGCNRVAERGIYYVFREDATGELKKFGSNCAKRYLGISVDAAVGKVFTYLYNMINGDFLGGMDDEEWRPGRGGGWRSRGYDEVAAACAYLALFGIPEARFSFKNCSEYEQLHRYYMTIDSRQPAVTTFQKEVDRNGVKINSYISSFYSNVGNFAKTINPQSSFDDAIKSHGLYLGGVGSFTKTAERYFKPGVFPYVVLKYFQAKRDEGIEVTPIEAFYGTKSFNVTILNTENKRRADGNGTYLQVYAKTENNEYLAWYQNDNQQLAIGSSVTIYGEYSGESGKYCMLNRVKVMGEQEIQQRDERAAIVYPADGTRLRSVTMSVIKSTANYIIFKDENGCEYFVSNTRKNRYGEVEGFVIAEWAQIFKPGNTIRLTGTVNSYVDRFGETKHTLKRVDYDTTSFPEIDWGQYPIDELIYDKRKIIVNGKPVDILDANRCSDCFIVRLTDSGYNTYSVYDPEKQEILLSGEYKKCVDFITYENVSLETMIEKNTIVIKTESGFELWKFWHFVKEIFENELDPYEKKGNLYLFVKFEKAHLLFAYYDPIEKKIVDATTVEPNAQVPEIIPEIKKLYDSLPEPAVSLNRADLEEMVLRCISALLNG